MTLLYITGITVRKNCTKKSQLKDYQICNGIKAIQHFFIGGWCYEKLLLYGVMRFISQPVTAN